MMSGKEVKLKSTHDDQLYAEKRESLKLPSAVAEIYDANAIHCHIHTHKLTAIPETQSFVGPMLYLAYIWSSSKWLCRFRVR
jgi:hypothetical protein